jgi:ABC-type branched-subunit amino acid transport system substrate-binding protein
MVDALIENTGLKPEEIAFFTQRDAYGDAGYTGGIAALKRHGLTDISQIAHGRYPRNTLAVENAVADIMQAPVPCKAVIMVGSYAPCASFIRIAEEVGLNALYLNVSFVGAKHLASDLGEHGDGVIVTQVVPSPLSDSEIVQSYRSAMKSYQPDEDLTYGSLEGYISMRLFIRALTTIDGVIERESIVDALESLGEFSLDQEIKVSLSESDHQASDRVWASVIRDGNVEPFDWSHLNERLTGLSEGAAHGE